MDSAYFDAVLFVFAYIGAVTAGSTLLDWLDDVCRAAFRNQHGDLQ